MFPVPFARRAVVKGSRPLVRTPSLHRSLEHLEAAAPASRHAVCDLNLAQHVLERLPCEQAPNRVLVGYIRLVNKRLVV